MPKDDSSMQKNIRTPEFNLNCEGIYDPESIKYTINMTLDLSNQHPLVIEALLPHNINIESFRFAAIRSGMEEHNFTNIPPKVCMFSKLFGCVCVCVCVCVWRVCILQENVTEVTVLTLSPSVSADFVITSVSQLLQYTALNVT